MIARGITPPEKFDEPEVDVTVEFFVLASIHLLSCRQVGMDVGPVPWTAVVIYCKKVGYSDWERMFHIVSQIDQGLRDDKDAA